MSGLRLEYMSPTELRANPANGWKIHTQQQVSALSAAMARIGWAGACLMNEETGLLVDGHARVEIAIKNKEERIPVLVGRWGVDGERLILASLDPIGALFARDEEQYSALVSGLDADMAAILAPTQQAETDIELDDGEIESKPDLTKITMFIPKDSASAAKRDAKALAAKYGGVVLA